MHNLSKTVSLLRTAKKISARFITDILAHKVECGAELVKRNRE